MTRSRPRSRRATLLRALLATIAGALLLAPAAARADVPPTPDCMYYVTRCDPIYGTGVTVGSGQVVEQGATVRLSSALEAPIPWNQPINPTCVGSIGQTCIYWSIAWKIEPPLAGSSPVSNQSGCGGSDPTCTFTYTTRAIGDYGDIWQPIVAALQSGQTPTRKVGWLIYARPRWRWVTVTAPAAVNYPPLYLWAVRSGTNPTFGSCLDANSIFGGTVPANLDCVRVSGTGGGSTTSPTWRLPLPSASGSWHLYPGPYPRGEAGPATTAGQRFTGADVTLVHSDIEGTTSPLPTGRLEVAIDTGGSLLGLGAANARTVTVTARAVGGQAPLRSARWYLNVLTRSGRSTTILNENAPPDAVLMPGESIRATATLRGDALGTDTLSSRVEAYDSKGDSVFGTAPPVTVTVVRDAPPPGGGGGGGRPRPPIPAAARAAFAAGISGRVEDQLRTTYTVSWYAAGSCGASDGDARLLGTRTVTTDGAGNGDASLTPLAGPAPGEAVFGYSALGGVRSDRSACVTARAVPLVALEAPATVAAGGGGRATVTVTAPGVVAGGTVRLLDGGAELASGPLAGGAATLALPTSLRAGSHTLQAVYGGDALVAGATSESRPVTVTAAGGRGARARPAAATWKLGAVAARARAGRPFTLTVTVARGRAKAGSGTVTVRRGRSAVAGPVKVRGGKAALRLRLPRGRQTLTVVYQPRRPAKAVKRTVTVTVAR